MPSTIGHTDAPHLGSTLATPAARQTTATQGSGPSLGPHTDQAPAIAAPHRAPTGFKLQIRRATTFGARGLSRVSSWASDASTKVESWTKEKTQPGPSTALRRAVRANRHDDVVAALERGGNTSKRSYNAGAEFGHSALTIAASMPELDPRIGDLLVARGNLDWPLGSEAARGTLGMRRVHAGDTALHQCVRSGNYRFAQQLVQWGANVTLKNKAGETAGQLAFKRWKAQPDDGIEQQLLATTLGQKGFMDEVERSQPPLPKDVLRTGLRQLRGIKHLDSLRLAVEHGDFSAVAHLTLSVGVDARVPLADGTTSGQVAFDKFHKEPQNTNWQRILVQAWPTGFLDAALKATPPVAQVYIREAVAHLTRPYLLTLSLADIDRLEPYLSDSQQDVRRWRDTDLHKAVRDGDLPQVNRLLGKAASLTELNREDVSAPTLALKLYGAQPGEDRAAIVFALMGLPAILDAFDKSTGMMRARDLESLVQLVPRSHLLTLDAKVLRRVSHMLLPQQREGLAERLSDTALAVRQRKLEDIKAKGPAQATPGAADGAFAFRELSGAQDDAVLQEAIALLMPMSEFVRKATTTTTALKADTIRAVARHATRDMLLAMDPDAAALLTPYLSAEQTEMLASGDTSLHLAARTGDAATVRAFIESGRSTQRRNGRDEWPLQLAMHRFQNHPDDGGAADVALEFGLRSFHDFTLQLVSAGKLTTQRMEHVLRGARKELVDALSIDDLNRFGWMLSPAALERWQRAQAIAPWVRSLTPRELDRFDADQFREIAQHLTESQVLDLMPQQRELAYGGPIDRFAPPDYATAAPLPAAHVDPPPVEWPPAYDEASSADTNTRDPR